MSSVCTQFKCQTVLFDPLIKPYQVVLQQVRVDLGVMAKKRYSASPKTPGLEPEHQSVYIQSTHWWGSYLSAEMQSVYPTAPADCAKTINSSKIMEV